MSVISKIIYGFNRIPIKILGRFFCRCTHNNSNMYMEGQRNRIAKRILKNNQVGGKSLADFKTYYTATITKTVWCLRRERHREQCNETAQKQIHTNITSWSLTSLQWRKNNFVIDGTRKLDIHYQKMDFD